ncbi:MAG: Fic family protein, partial [Clostridia bacterium]
MKIKYDYNFPEVIEVEDKQYIIEYVKKILPDCIFDIASVEGTTFTLPEVISTVVDGFTTNGHPIEDISTITNLKDVFKQLFDLIKNNHFSLDITTINGLHSILMKNLTYEIGKFRTRNISVTGTKIYKCIDSIDLNNTFNEEIKEINNIKNPIEKAVIMLLWISYSQFYLDGNKRMARILSSGYLINEGIGILNIPNKYIAQFRKLLTEFYDTLDANKIIDFLIKNCLFNLGKSRLRYSNGLEYISVIVIAKKVINNKIESLRVEFNNGSRDDYTIEEFKKLLTKIPCNNVDLVIKDNKYNLKIKEGYNNS